ncbi:hypothetical protein CCP3SC15_1290003 [Gammaproteobacteria bacterium]
MNKTPRVIVERDDELAPGMDVTVVADPDRRDALRKLGRYTAYAAPAMMAMLSHRAIAQPSSS